MVRKMHILTFDIEDWFHILDNPGTADIAQWINFPSRLESGVRRLLDLCDRNSVKATFFVLGWVAETAPDIVAEIASRGHEIACHSYRHQLVYTQTPEEFERDLTLALNRIEGVIGRRPTVYRAPGFSITSESTWAFEILARNGIEVDASVFPTGRAHGGLEGFPQGEPCILDTLSGKSLRMFPMSFSSVLGQRIVFSGGGYFRLLPYAALKVGFQTSEYLMTYFHPRDFDPDQPIVPGLSRTRRFKSYVGLSSALDKLERLMSITNFLSISDASSRIRWAEVPRVNGGSFGTKIEQN
jgi:polysaccharide deacetylase family protein (PEP-CTERM system associated)